MSEEKSLEGIGGWLIIVAISIVISPIRAVVIGVTTYVPIFSSGAWQALTTQGSDVYNPLWAPIIIGEILINSALIVAWLYMAYKFFTKSSAFPKWYIGIAIFSLVFIIVDAFSIKLVLPNEPVFDSSTRQELMRSLIMVVIWVPYMLVSKRVKATFIK